MTDKRFSGDYILGIVIGVFATWLIHEFAHWLTSESLGYDSIMTLNGVSAEVGVEVKEKHKLWISAAGPIITIVQAFMAYFALQFRKWNKYIYVVLFTAFYMRFAAGIMNVISLNDEGRIGESLGIGKFTIPLIVSAFLFYLVYKVSRGNKLKWKFQLATTIAVIVFSSLLIIADMKFGIRIL